MQEKKKIIFQKPSPQGETWRRLVSDIELCFIETQGLLDRVLRNKSLDPETRFELQALRSYQKRVVRKKLKTKLPRAIRRMFRKQYLEVFAGAEIQAKRAREQATKAKEQARRSEDKARMDELTGLLRKDVFEEAMTRMLSISAPSDQRGTLTACWYMDVRYLKQVNDKFGHGPGDYVLAKVGYLINEHLRSGVGDLRGRVGGDECAVFIRGIANREAVNHITQRFQRSFHEVNWQTVAGVPPGVGFPKVQVDVGVAIEPTLAQGSSPEEAKDHAIAFRKEAESAMYEAKNKRETPSRAVTREIFFRKSICEDLSPSQAQEHSTT